MGHIIDLPKSRIGIDIENDFKPEYITVRGKGKILTDLKKYAANAKTVLLASDNDREGEAIAFHIYDALSKRFPDLPIKRIVFNEITKNAIVESVKAPKDIDNAKVEAQEARRILDRLIGYKISPILWVKVKNGLSAGRVQSVALKAICQREEEIQSFVPQEYWTLNAILEKDKKSLVRN
jgi:DNA topoisomerase-1